MSQIILTIATVYGAPYLANYIINKATTIALNKTTTVVKKKVSDIIYKDPNNDISVEYEYINIDNDNNIIQEPIVFVTSKKHKTIDQSWNDISSMASSTYSLTNSMQIYRPPSATNSALHTTNTNTNIIQYSKKSQNQNQYQNQNQNISDKKTVIYF